MPTALQREHPTLWTDTTWNVSPSGPPPDDETLSSIGARQTKALLESASRSLNDVVARLDLSSETTRDSFTASAHQGIHTDAGAAPELRVPASKTPDTADGAAASDTREQALETPKTPGQHGTSTTAENFDPSSLQGASALRYWIAKIQAVVDDCSETQLVDTLERFKKQNKIQRDEQQKKSDELQRKEDAAKVVSTVMGWFGKILGAIITVASVVSAIFTGGASLVLAGIGLALMAGDFIAEIITGKSPIGELLNPIIQKVFLPIVKAFGSAFSAVLKKLGVNDELADIIGNALGTVAAMIAVLAIGALAKSSQVTNLASRMIQPLMRAISKFTPQLMKNVARQVASAASKVMSSADAASESLSRSASTLAKKVGMNFNGEVVGLHMQRVAVTTVATNATAQAGAGAWMGVNEKQMAEAIATIGELTTDMSQMQSALDIVVQFWQKQTHWVEALQKTLSDSTQAELQSSLHTLNNTRRLAV